jgi:hypothetical protein
MENLVFMGSANEILKALTLRWQVWAKAQQISGYDPAIWRRDSMGTPIRFSDYGDRNSQHGWEFDHIDPNGSDDLSNLQPLNWRNNVAKSDKPSFSAMLDMIIGGTRRR